VDTEYVMNETIVDQARQRIRRMILDGSLSAGEPLRQDELAQLLGISRTPLREALSALAAEGLVQMNPRRSATVFRPTKKELEELYELRILLESVAVKKAAANFPRSSTRQLKAMIKQMDAVNDSATFNQLNVQFHDACYAPCAQTRLLELITLIRSQSALYSEMVLGRGTSERDKAREDHRELLRALEEQNPELASEIVVRHLQTTIDVISLELSGRLSARA
jgi:DNA-binding GntR family transcriptional regulator